MKDETKAITRTVSEDLATVPIGKHFKITPIGLEIIGNPSIDAFGQLGEMLRTFERTLQFVIGDYINEAENRHGEKASQLIDASGWSESTVKTYAWTAKNVPKHNRMIDAGLSYAHHQLVAGRPPSEQRQWLTQALNNGAEDGPWPVSKLKAAIKSGSDLLPASYWVMAQCKDAKDQEKLVKILEREGRTVKALERH